MSIFIVLKLLFSYLVPIKCLIPIGHIHDTDCHYHISAVTDFLNKGVKLLKPKDSCSAYSFVAFQSFQRFIFPCYLLFCTGRYEI